jgi:hypothetical protein
MQSVGNWLAVLLAHRRMSRSLAAACFDTIRANAAACLFALGFARYRRLVGGIPRVGMGKHQRINDSRVGSFSLFARFEDCGTRDARRARITWVDIRLVPPHLHRRQCYLLFCDFCADRLPG